MWAAIWQWIRNHPQRTSGMVQVLAGSLLSTIPTLDLTPRTLAIILAFFGAIQAVFGFLHSAPPEVKP